MRLACKSTDWLLVTVIVISVAIWSSAGAEESLSLDLEKCVQMALDVNVNVLKAGYSLSQAKSSVITSASQLLPQVAFVQTHSKYEQFFPRQVGDKVDSTDASYSSAFSITETVTFESVMAMFESMSNKNAARHYVHQIRQDVAFLAKQKYLEVLKAGRLLTVREEALDLSDRRLEKAQALMEVGSAVKSDVLRAQVERSRNELELITARNALRLAETDLRHFLDIGDEVDLDLEDVLEAQEVDYVLASALSEAAEKRPDILSAAETLKAAGRGVWREAGGWFPRVQFRWSDRYTLLEFPDQPVSFGDESDWSWDLSASINLFDGFYTLSRVKSARAYRRSVEEDLAQRRRDVTFEVKQAYYNVEEARQRVKVSSETVGLAEEELRLAEERFRLGGGTMLEQIDAQVTLSEARKSYVEALYDYVLSKAKIEKAMGKD
jgi:outer membrane protein TolC